MAKINIDDWTLRTLQSSARRGWGLSTDSVMKILSVTKYGLKEMREAGLRYDPATQAYKADDLLKFIVKQKQNELASEHSLYSLYLM